MYTDSPIPRTSWATVKPNTPVRSSSSKQKAIVAKWFWAGDAKWNPYDGDQIEKLEAALEAGDFGTAAADLEDGDVDEFCFCLREQLGAMSDELHRREGILRGYGDGRRY